MDVVEVYVWVDELVVVGVFVVVVFVEVGELVFVRLDWCFGGEVQ